MREGFFLNHPAKGWETGLPVGNGRQGAVLFGTAETEKILLNEESLWYGGKQERGQEAGREKLAELRSLLAEGKAEEAQRLCGRYLSSYPRYMNPYHPAAEAILTFWGMEAEKEGEAYRRGLDWQEGEVWVESGTQRRVLFSSSHDQVTLLHLESKRGKRWNMELGLNRRPFEQEAESAEAAIYLSGQSGEGGVHYCVGCMAGESDGSWKVEGGYLVLQEASFAELLFCVCTDYEGEDAKASCKNRLERAKEAGYEEVYARHKRDYAAQYNRMQLQLSFDEELSKLPADVLLKRAGEPKVRAYLTQLLFSYARYLLISSSTNCLLPANLQGIWNGSFTPPWESGYTININLQMNYWMADAAGLGECFTPFLRLLERMLPNGRETARKVYGCEGFVAHHNTNLWGDTDITGLWIPAACWVTGGAWMANQVYQHASYEENEKECFRFWEKLCVSFMDICKERAMAVW
ncbi:MAG: glycoside hydrolase N-terminal domain-containing protein [bacterium]|nr:glycoside hydrolase N-terminal domain-containing protein [bacterium]